MAIPFKSLLVFQCGGPRSGEMNFRRFIKWKNEMRHQTPMPPLSFRHDGNLNGWDYAATLLWPR
jgi:hypothetical protein